jgi:putative phosphoesterase
MRIALLSDTHGSHARALRALERVAPIDLAIHLGDGYEDMDVISPTLSMPYHVVAGNCDRFSDTPRELQLTVADKKLLATHGDFYRVKFGLDALLDRARSISADIVAFGHTHCALISVIDGITLVNPGALAKGEQYPSIAVITITAGEISAEIVRGKF